MNYMTENDGNRNARNETVELRLWRNGNFNRMPILKM